MWFLSTSSTCGICWTGQTVKISYWHPEDIYSLSQQYSICVMQYLCHLTSQIYGCFSQKSSYIRKTIFQPPRLQLVGKFLIVILNILLTFMADGLRAEICCLQFLKGVVHVWPKIQSEFKVGVKNTRMISEWWQWLFCFITVYESDADKRFCHQDAASTATCSKNPLTENLLPAVIYHCVNVIVWHWSQCLLQYVFFWL